MLAHIKVDQKLIFYQNFLLIPILGLILILMAWL